MSGFWFLETRCLMKRFLVSWNAFLAPNRDVVWCDRRLAMRDSTFLWRLFSATRQWTTAVWMLCSNVTTWMTTDQRKHGNDSGRFKLHVYSPTDCNSDSLVHSLYLFPKPQRTVFYCPFSSPSFSHIICLLSLMQDKCPHLFIAFVFPRQHNNSNKSSSSRWWWWWVLMRKSKGKPSCGE